MKCNWVVCAVGLAVCSAAEVRPLSMMSVDSFENRRELLTRPLAVSLDVSKASVFPGDTVIPALSAGPGARMEMTFLSLSDRAVGFTIRFFKADGADLYLSLGENGRMRGGHVTLRRGELFRISTEKQEDFVEGFAVISTDELSDCVGAVSRLIITGEDGVDRSVTIPTLNKYENRAMLMLDSRGGRRAYAQIMNGASRATEVKVTLRDAGGNAVASETVAMPPYSAAGGYLDKLYSAETVAGRSVYLEVTATDFGVAVVGMETGGGMATMVPALKNPDW